MQTLWWNKFLPILTSFIVGKFNQGVGTIGIGLVVLGYYCLEDENMD